MDRLKSLQTLTMVIETGGFSKAANALGMGQPAVSKAISALEREFGVKLLNRGTHFVREDDPRSTCYHEQHRERRAGVAASRARTHHWLPPQTGRL